MEYHRNVLPTPISVRSLIVCAHISIRNRTPKGENSYSFPELVYVDRGVFNITVEGEVYSLKAGEAMLYAPHAYHVGRFVENAIIDIIGFDTDSSMLSSLYNRVFVLDATEKRLLSHVVRLGNAHFRHISKASGELGYITKEDTDDVSLMMLKNRLELFLLELLRKKERVGIPPTASNQENFKDDQFFAITAFLKNNISKSFTLEEIAERSGISVTQLKSLFRTRVGCGPITYFLSLKIGEAKRLIGDTSLNFTEISERLGFSSIHYFSKLFKAKTGMTPTEYANSVYQI